MSIFAAIPGAIQGIIGGVQAISGGARAKRAQRQMEKMIDSYQKSESIMDYYNKALQRYNQNPYDSNLYRMQAQAGQRNLATGLNAMQDRRSALASVGNLVQGSNDAALRAAATAEGQQAQALGQLGQATQMKDREDKYKFEAKYNLLGMKAGGGSQIMNAGIQNLYGGLGSLSDYMLANVDAFGNNTPTEKQATDSNGTD